MFVGFIEGGTYVKMKKPGKKKSLESSWEGPFLFVNYLNGKGSLEQDEGGHICVIKGRDDELWIDLEEIYRSIMLHLDGGDWGTQSKMFGSGYICGLTL
jgi:hypothetical protein